MISCNVVRYKTGKDVRASASPHQRDKQKCTVFIRCFLSSSTLLPSVFLVFSWAPPQGKHTHGISVKRNGGTMAYLSGILPYKQIQPMKNFKFAKRVN